MTYDQIQEFRFYIGGKVRQDRIAARNSKDNGYLSVSLTHENEAVFGEKLLQYLNNERGGLD